MEWSLMTSFAGDARLPSWHVYTVRNLPYMHRNSSVHTRLTSINSHLLATAGNFMFQSSMKFGF